MEDYNLLLAEEVLTQDKVVTYRHLSHSQKVHVNTAKQMLYAFHKSQNAKKPGSIHATYLLYGSKRSEEARAQDDGDIEMSSSMPEFESFSEHIPALTLSLVREEELEDVLSQYEQLTSIHMYSIGPHPMKDLQLLADTTQQVGAANAGEAILEPLKVYGTITNTHVRRRERQGVAPQPEAPSIAKPDVKAALEKSTTQPVLKSQTKSSSQSAAAKTSKGGTSGIMAAFAQGANAKPKKKPESSAATKSKPVESPPVALSDDGEDDSEPVPRPRHADNDDVARKSRKQREDELRLMMEEDDDDDSEEAEEKEDTAMEEAAPMEEPAVSNPVKEEPAEVITASSGDGRRRGKRHVMKKKQIMDDDGYLVTIQEKGWESFSEDEPELKPKKSTTISPTSSNPNASQAGKPPKRTAKPGQGSITSFFSKK